MNQVVLLAGCPGENPTLYREIGLPAGDPAASIHVGNDQYIIIRDIEVDRARQTRPNAVVACPADFAPASGLDADRATATAQAVTEFCQRQGLVSVTTDRTLPFVFAWYLMQQNIRLRYDADLGVRDRRTKNAAEIAALQQAQQVTEQGMLYLCRLIANCEIDANGILMHAGTQLTSQRARALAAAFFSDRGFSMGHGAIVATAPHSADCHHAGEGPLRTGLPIIVDLFPRDDRSRYWGDCTRTVVHGQPSATVRQMHHAVVQAKAAAVARLMPGNDAADVHRAVVEVQQQFGFPCSRGTLTNHASIQHGTGHGIGLEVHEPILLDEGGGKILAGEVFTIEPGLYGRDPGGVRVEDMYVVTANGPRNLNQLPEGLDWSKV